MMYNFEMNVGEYSAGIWRNNEIKQMKLFQSEIALVDKAIEAHETKIAERNIKEHRIFEEAKRLTDKFSKFHLEVQQVSGKQPKLEQFLDKFDEWKETIFKRVDAIKAKNMFGDERATVPAQDAEAVAKIHRLNDLKATVKKRKEMMKKFDNGIEKKLAQIQESFADLRTKQNDIDGLKKEWREMCRKEDELKADNKMKKWNKQTRRSTRR